MEYNVPRQELISDPWWTTLLTMAVAVNLLGLLVPVIEPDGALYATIAKTMVQSGNYTDLVYNGKDWLDKPHFPFWMMALSFQCVGVTSLGYKLPALLFWLLSLFYTYQFARLFYPKTVARLSVLILATALHGIISNTDVRAEPYLMGLVMGAVYHLFKVSRRLNWFDLVVGSLMAACAMMTKGIFLVLVISSGLLIHGLIKRRWSLIFNLKWILCAALVVIFISPELICLYKQFDLHPEKLVFGRENVSGLQFFLWDSQFGRFFNTGPIRGEGDPFFFLHTVLWSFFPWSLVFYLAFFQSFKAKLLKQKEWISIGTVALTFLLFSLSKFQLPHYLNAIFPFMSVLCGVYLFEVWQSEKFSVWVYVFRGQAFLAFVLALVLLFYFHPSSLVAGFAWIIGGLLVILGITRKMTPFPSALVRNVMGCLLLFSFISLFIIPDMVQYQSGARASAYFIEHEDQEPLMLADDISFSFDFYCPGEVKHITMEELGRRRSGSYLFCHERFIPLLEEKGFKITPVKTYPHYHITEPRGAFMNWETRKSTLENYRIVKVI